MAEKEKQHTPTPFKSECIGSEGYQIRPILNKSLLELKAEYGGLNEKFYDRVYPITNLYGEFFQQKANAEFIVKACNNYESMLEALKFLLNPSFGNDGWLLANFPEAYALCSKALKKTEEV